MLWNLIWLFLQWAVGQWVSVFWDWVDCTCKHILQELKELSLTCKSITFYGPEVGNLQSFVLFFIIISLLCYSWLGVCGYANNIYPMDVAYRGPPKGDNLNAIHVHLPGNSRLLHAASSASGSNNIIYSVLNSKSTLLRQECDRVLLLKN